MRFFMVTNSDFRAAQPDYRSQQHQAVQQGAKEITSGLRNISLPSSSKELSTIKQFIGKFLPGLGRMLQRTDNSGLLRTDADHVSGKMKTLQGQLTEKQKSLDNLQKKIEINSNVNAGVVDLKETIKQLKQEIVDLRKEWHESKKAMEGLEKALHASPFKNASHIRKLRGNIRKIDTLYKNILSDPGFSEETKQTVRIMTKVETQSTKLRELENAGALRKTFTNIDQKISKTKVKLESNKMLAALDTLRTENHVLKPDLAKTIGTQLNTLQSIKHEAFSQGNEKLANEVQQFINDSIAKLGIGEQGASNYVQVLDSAITEACNHSGHLTRSEENVLVSHYRELGQMNLMAKHGQNDALGGRIQIIRSGLHTLIRTALEGSPALNEITMIQLLTSSLPVQQKRMLVSQFLVDVKGMQLKAERSGNQELKEALDNILSAYHKEIETLFADDPLHVGFALQYPEAAENLIQTKFQTQLAEEKDTGKGKVPIYDRNKLETTKSTFLPAFFENMKRVVSQEMEPDGRKRCTAKNLRTSIESASESDLKSFLTALANQCEEISRTSVLEGIMIPKLSEGISTSRIGTFTQQAMVDQHVTQTSAWDVVAAKVVMGTDSEREARLETSTGEQVIVTSLKKDLGASEDNYSGDGARSFTLQNGVSAHVVVDAAGNSEGYFGATAALIDMVSRRVEARTNDLNIANPEDIQNFIKEIIEEGMKICGERGEQCTFNFNLIFPGADGKRLLVGVSAGDTFVFTRKPDGNGSNEVKVLTTTLDKEQSYSGGAFGYNIASAPRIFDVFCHELAPDEELYMASDAVGDNFELVENQLREGADVSTALLPSIIQRGNQQKKMEMLF